MALIEWPERVGMDHMPSDRLDLHFVVPEEGIEGEAHPHEDEDEAQSRIVRYGPCHPSWAGMHPHVLMVT